MEMTQNWLDYSIIALYMAAVLGIGFFFARKNETTESYLLGGRNMPYLAIGLSCMMSLFSSISIVNIPGEIYNNGFTIFALTVPLTLPLAIPYYLLFTRFYFKLGSFTPYEYLEYRYDWSVRAIVALSAFYARILYLGMVLYTTAKIFQGAYGWDAWITILLVGVIGVLYTVLGGMKAVVWTDVMQFFVLGGGLLFVIVVLCMSIDGGPVEAVACAFRDGHGAPQYRQAEFYSITPYARLLFFLLLWNAVIGPLTGACSDQINIQRLLSTKDWKAGFKSQIIAAVTGMSASMILYFIGFAVYTYYQQNPDPVLAKLGGDAAFFRFVATKLPAPLPGIFMAAMLAAIMSTLDSGINSMATVWLKEMHAKFINKEMTVKQEVSVSRWATFLIGALAVTLGLGLDISGKWLSQSVMEVSTVFGLIGAATLPAFLFAVLSKRANSTLIWAYTFFAFGEGIGKNIWYVSSRISEQAWLKDPSVGFGWAGKLDLIYFLLPLFIGLICCLPYLNRSWRNKISTRVLVLAGMIILGVALNMGLWYAYSNTMISDVPKACSFAFSLPVSFLGAFVILWFCPVQPREKYQGLTLQTLNKKIIALRK